MPRRALAIVVVLLLAPVLALTALQQLVSEGPWWLELSRYLPFPLLVAPAVVALVITLALGWRWVAASLATIAVFVVFATGLAWSGGPPAGALPDLRLMTYNVKANVAFERPGGVGQLAAEIARHDPDVLVMQDTSPLLRGHDPAQPTPLFGLPDARKFGQYIVASRWPLRDCRLEQIPVGAEALTVARCDVVLGGGRTLALVDVHFESPRNGLLAARRQGIDGIDLWAGNHAGRLAQARALAKALAGVPRPMVVAGDLNAPDSSAVLQSLFAVGLRDAFASAGRGFGYTYGHTLRPRFSFLRIDHVLVSDGIEVLRAFAGGEAPSDHRPVIADLRLPHAASAVPP